MLAEDAGDGARVAAAHAVASLSGDNAGRKAVVKADAMPLLVVLLATGCEDGQVAAASAIAALAEQDSDDAFLAAAKPVPPTPWEVFSEANVVEPLVALLSKGGLAAKAQGCLAFLR